MTVPLIQKPTYLKLQTRIVTSPEDAAVYIRSGQVCAFPTETVYGLGADAFNPIAIQQIFEAKGRPGDNPLIVHIFQREQINTLATEVPDYAVHLIEQFFPGPLTIVLPRRPEVPGAVTGGLSTIGIRMPDHPVALDFLTACNTPVAAPSANRSGKPSPTTWQAVYEDLDGRIPCILKSDPTPFGLESTVVDCTGTNPIVLRHGSVPFEALVRSVPATTLRIHNRDLLARSPGTRYRHYAPHARVFLIDRPEEIRDPAGSTYIGLTMPPKFEDLMLVQKCSDVADYARRLFDFFRRSDDLGARFIFCQRVDPSGIGRAIMDRITRASTP